MFSKSFVVISLLGLLNLGGLWASDDDEEYYVREEETIPGCGSVYCAAQPCDDLMQLTRANCTEKTLLCHFECVCETKCDKIGRVMTECYNSHDCYIRGRFGLHPGMRRRLTTTTSKTTGHRNPQSS